MLKTRNRVLIVAALIALVLASPCLAAEPVKIGYVHVFSGPMTTFGQVARQGAQLAVNEINGEGGVDGRKIEIFFADTAANPDVAKAAIENLVKKENVSVIIGIVSSAVAKAVTPMMNDLKCPLIITDAMSDEVTGSLCNPWTFRMTWNMDQCYKAAALLAKDFGPKKWTTLGPDYGFGQDSWKYFRKYGQEAGGLTFEPGTFVPLGTKDWAQVIDNLQKTAPDGGLMVSLWGNDLKTFLQQAHQQGVLKGRTVLCPVGGAVETFIALGFLDLPPGIWFGSPYWFEAYDNSFNDLFVKAYASFSLSGIPPPYAAYNSYAAVKIFKTAVWKAESSDRTAVAKALSGLIVDGLPVGAAMFREGDHQAVFDVAFGMTSAHPSKYYRKIRGLDPIRKFKGMEITPPATESGCKMQELPQ
jgi:branched-chain amino acid transport system substrate-binding protein